jgi:hypothetical protein
MLTDAILRVTELLCLSLLRSFTLRCACPFYAFLSLLRFLSFYACPIFSACPFYAPFFSVPVPFTLLLRSVPFTLCTFYALALLRS